MAEFSIRISSAFPSAGDARAGGTNRNAETETMKTVKSIKVAGRSVRVSNERSKKGLYTATLYLNGRQKWKALDTTVFVTAETRARAWAQSIFEGKWEALQSVASRNEWATVGEVVDAMRRSGLVRDRSATEYGRALVRLVSRARGIDGDAARAVRCSDLTGDLVDAYVARVQGLPTPDYSKTVRAGNNSINSTLANAKACFGAKLLRAYGKADLKIPKLESFLEAPRVQPEPVGFQVPRPEVIADLIRASMECEQGRTDLFLVTQMMLCMGLDAGEVMAARGGWLEDGALVIKARPEEGFQGKTSNRGRRLAVPAHLMAYFAGAGDAFVVLPKGTPTERWNLVYREHSAWLRTWFPKDRYTKTNHSLRKLGGTLMADREGSARAGAQFLGNREETFQRHYSGQRSATCLELGDFVQDGNEKGEG